jgi:catechol 2,3-dioxygenase-like lactoylglutathione lyase family enzyme
VAKNEKFELRGVNHIALVSSDMARTVHFYRDVLGMPLVKTIDLPDGMGQHFFFDIGNNDCLAFFWFPGAGAAQPGVSNAPALPGAGDITSAHASMNHLAFDVPLDRFEDYRQKLIDAGVEVSMVLDHDDSPDQVARVFHPGVFVRSFYFFDPDGVMLEFASWTRVMGRPEDVTADPVDAQGERVQGLIPNQLV